MYKKYIKRVLDFLLALIFILFLSPLLLIIFIILLFTLKKEVIFSQYRIGLNKKPYKIYKFRTMINDTTIPDKERITKFGKILRNTSLDELPQLFNVLIGNMSIVGPRPFIYGEKLPNNVIIPDYRYSVKPGITGLAQVHGKRHITHKDKIKYDCIYAKKVSFFMDLSIILKTILVMIKKNN